MDIMLLKKIICNFVTQGGSRSSSPKGKRSHTSASNGLPKSLNSNASKCNYSAKGHGGVSSLK